MNANFLASMFKNTHQKFGVGKMAAAEPPYLKRIGQNGSKKGNNWKGRKIQSLLLLELEGSS